MSGECIWTRTAAEVDVNLETAVRAAAPAHRSVIFDACNPQMERLDTSTGRQPDALRWALGAELARVAAVAPSPRAKGARPSGTAPGLR